MGKQAVIKNAAYLLQPHPASGELASADASAVDASSLSIENAYFEVGDVVALEPFARFVFVLSVLEQHSQRECALMLGTSVKEVRKVRVQAIEQVSEFTRHHAPANTSGLIERTHDHNGAIAVGVSIGESAGVSAPVNDASHVVAGGYTT